MTPSRADDLINKLIANKLSGDELTELLAGISNENEKQKYSDALEIYFNQLLRDNRDEPE